MLTDRYGRSFGYLRLSLTEACNMSCQYCLPKGYPDWARSKARLGLEELTTILAGFRLLGFRKVRLTGGEPTLHPKCLAVVERAKELGYEQISMTTNGLKLDDIQRWKDSGLTGLNISCDSIDQKIFSELTGSNDLSKVLDLIESASLSGLLTKVNVVLLRSKNGQKPHVKKMIQWALDRPIILRFIELMDTGINRSFASSERVHGHEIIELMNEMGLAPSLVYNAASGTTHAMSPKTGVWRGPSTDYSFYDYKGKIGLINPLSCNFCSQCNRLRVTAKGRLKLCLFGDEDFELDLSSPEILSHQVQKLIALKGEKHHLERGEVGNVETFRVIGG